MNYWINFFFVFLGVTAADVCWAMYFYYISKEKSVMAGVYGMLVTLFGAYSIINYAKDWTFVLAAVAGGFVGTMITVEYNKRKAK